MIRHFVFAILLIGISVSLLPIEANSEPQSGLVPLPLNTPLFRIELDADAIYELTYTALADAGMAVDAVNPHYFELLHRGERVAYQLVGDDDAQFEPDEAIRFYGWAFAGTRYEKQYVTNNVFWLWVGDGSNSLMIPTIDNPDNLPTVTQVRHTFTIEPENLYSAYAPLDWQENPNSLDLWVWDEVDPMGDWVEFQLDVPEPVSTGEDAVISAEILPKGAQEHQISYRFNQLPEQSYSWDGMYIGTVTWSVPANTLNSGANSVFIKNESEEDFPSDRLFLNQITIAYDRALVASGSQFAFAHDDDGEFVVGGFESSDSADYTAWRLIDKHLPEAIAIDSDDVQADGSVRLGSDHVGQADFIITTEIQSPTAITQTQLEPTVSDVEWLAIAPQAWIGALQPLVAERQVEMDSGVVAWEMVQDRFGYGFPLPQAIDAFLQNVYAEWETQPNFLLLVGDTTTNPRQLACVHEECPPWWDASKVSYVPTHFYVESQSFLSNIVGADHQYTLLERDDGLPDLAIGRLPTNSSAEVSAIVDKILTYENNIATIAPHTRKALFIAGHNPNVDYCTQAETLLHLPPLDVAPTLHCQDSYDDMLTDDLLDVIADGVGIVNYSGDCTMTAWGNGLILNANHVSQFNNAGQPFVVLSVGLDGTFASPEVNALGEVWLREPNNGSAAHWSSVGLEYSTDANKMHQLFYQEQATHKLSRIGEIANAAKIAYAQTDNFQGLLYTFTLLGDPAMKIPPHLQEVLHLPLINK